MNPRLHRDEKDHIVCVCVCVHVSCVCTKANMYMQWGYRIKGGFSSSSKFGDYHTNLEFQVSEYPISWNQLGNI